MLPKPPDLFDDKYIEKLLEAIEHNDVLQAATLVQGYTGLDDKQALKVAVTFIEGLQEAEEMGLTF